jgi:xanthine dehydrogenase YagR molybdenum-binding subunit
MSLHLDTPLARQNGRLYIDGADVGSVEAHWVHKDDPYVNPMGAKGVGKLGIVGTEAAIANAAHHATGIRVPDLPITLDKLLQ